MFDVTLSSSTGSTFHCNFQNGTSVWGGGIPATVGNLAANFRSLLLDTSIINWNYAVCLCDYLSIPDHNHSNDVNGDVTRIIFVYGIDKYVVQSSSNCLLQGAHGV